MNEEGETECTDESSPAAVAAVASDDSHDEEDDARGEFHLETAVDRDPGEGGLGEAGMRVDVAVGARMAVGVGGGRSGGERRGSDRSCPTEMGMGRRELRIDSETESDCDSDYRGDDERDDDEDGGEADDGKLVVKAVARRPLKEMLR